jgi:hypothetical protein
MGAFPAPKVSGQVESDVRLDGQLALTTSGYFQLERPEVKIEIGKSKYELEQEQLARQQEQARQEQLKRATPKPKPISSSVVVASVPAEPTSKSTLCSCVMFAIAKSGKNPGPIGYAKNWPINSSTASIGAVVITKESSGKIYTGHVGVVVGVDSEFVYINDANYSSCQETHRKLPINSPLIRGYFT